MKKIALALVGVFFSFLMGFSALSDDKPDYAKTASDFTYQVITSKEVFDDYKSMIKNIFGLDLLRLEPKVAVLKEKSLEEITTVALIVDVTFALKDDKGTEHIGEQRLIIIIGVDEKTNTTVGGKIVGSTRIEIRLD